VKLFPRTKPLLFWSALGLVLLLMLMAWRAEPYANGQSLSTWLREGAELHSGSSVEVRFSAEEIEEALRKIGPRAIPHLLARLDEMDPPWKLKLSEWQSRTDWLPDGVEVEFRFAHERHYEAVFGFSVLGEQAVAAIPELEKRLGGTNGYVAAIALSEIGGAAVPVLGRAGQ
jgi:hypothetical protein